MKTNASALFLFLLLLSLHCVAQQTQTDLPIVENHLKGELDYTYEALDLVQTQQNGEEIKLGEITKDGAIHFNLPEFDIRALYDSIPLQHYNFQSLFLIDSSCKDRDVFAETLFDDVYAQKYKIFVKKYGINIAILEPASDSHAASSTYFWLYIDSAISFKDECIKISPGTTDIYATISANIQFEKGWNFIEENLEKVQDHNTVDSLNTQASKIHFTKILPANKKVKWTLRQIMKDEKIQTAKTLNNLTPLTKVQFEKWVPKKLGDLSVTSNEHGNPPKGRKNKNNVHLTFVNETEKKEIDLYVIDCAKSPDDMNMINFAYAMENDGKDEKDIKPYITRYSEQEKATQLVYKVGDRIIVNASGLNINAEELWVYIQKLNVEKLLK